MTSKGLAVDPSMFAGGAYGAQLAAFANAYANTEGFYNSSVFDCSSFEIPLFGKMVLIRFLK